MDKTLRISFFWHMHQPYYADDESGLIEMPWVFLHALKDYHEMLWHLERHPKIKATFNLSPALLIQLERYKSVDVKDKLLMLLRRPVASLNTEERNVVERYVRAAHSEYQVKPLKRYAALYEKQRTDILNDEELCEMEVLFLLAWCGNGLRENDDTVMCLLEKEAGYTEEDKALLLAALAEFVGTIVPAYKKLAEDGRIALSINPMYHPIMPLLLDMHSATQSRPGTKMPDVACCFEQDAQRQLDAGIETFIRLFGFRPHGIWPSEGSVSDDSLQMYQDADLLFAASDEEILFESLEEGMGGENNVLYRPYRFKSEEGLILVFRDKDLSDRIGFRYAKMDPAAAAGDFIDSLREIYENGENDALVSVILDGENAWEHYPNNAQDFFDALYGAIEREAWCECVTLKEVATKADEDYKILGHVQPGSWIYRDFSTWIGQDEKNKAWEMLCNAKRTVGELHTRKELNEKDRVAIRREFMIAEGSDWFWWYGDGHETEYADLFDMLFRKHLINIYTHMKMAPPLYLLKPIHVDAAVDPQASISKGFISPVLSGREENFFEWFGAGVIESDMITNVMDTSNKGIIKRLRYGFDRHCLYLSLEGSWKEVAEKKLSIELLGDLFDPVLIPLVDARSMEKKRTIGSSLQGVVDRAAELCVPIARVAAEGERTIALQVVLKERERELERFPAYDMAHLTLYDSQKKDWFV
jgi:alpha-amylase/alpha-mannosidase (GH57 family)